MNRIFDVKGIFRTIAFGIVITLFTQLANGQKYSYNYNNQSLTFALNTISSKYNLKIAFDNQVADRTIINKSILRASIDESLNIITEGTGLKVQRMGDVYMIIPISTVQIKKEDTPIVISTPIVVKKYLYGLVKDKLSGETLPYASIYLSKNHLGVNTNSDGYFKIEFLSTDTAYFVIHYLGYSPMVCKCLPGDGLQVYLLDPLVQELQSVEVRENIEIFDNTGTNTEHIKFSPSKMANIPALTELDMMTPLQMLPGINATDENAGGFCIRKSQPDKSLMVYDGFTLYHMNHFFGAFSSINTKAVKDIQVYKGGFGADYGGSSSSIIDITGKSGNMQKTKIDVGIDMLAVDATFEIPLIKNRCSLLVAGRRSYTDKIRTSLYNSLFENVRYDFNSYYRNPPAAFSSNSNEPVYFYDDLNAKLTFRLPADNILSVSTFNSFDKINYQDETAFPKINELTHWDTHGASARWAGKFGKAWESNAVLGLSNTSFGYNYSDSIRRKRIRIIGPEYNYINKSSDIDSWFKNISLNWNNAISISNNQKIEAGISVQQLESNYSYQAESFFNQTNLLDTSQLYYQKAQLRSLWCQFDLFGEKWNLKPGIRLNKYSIINKPYPELRVSGFYRINPSVQIRGMAGNYFQFVNKLDVNKRGDFRSAWVISDGAKMPVVASFQMSTGLNLALTPFINLDIEGYYKEMRNLTSSLEEYRYVSGKVNIRNTNWVHESHIKGIDVLLKQTYGIYQLWTAYTLSSSKSIYKRNGKTSWYPSDDDQLHELKFLHLLKLHNVVLSMNNIIGSGGVWDQYQLNNKFQLSNSYQKNGAQMPAYFRIDAGLNYSIHIKNSIIKLAMNFFNLLDNKNVIQRFDKISDTAIEDIMHGINPLVEETVYGLGYSWNCFVNISF